MMTFSITMLFHYADCLVLFIVMLSVIMLSVIMLSVIMLNVVMLSVVVPVSSILANVRRCCKCLSLTNTLAYFFTPTIDSCEKKF